MRAAVGRRRQVVHFDHVAAFKQLVLLGDQVAAAKMRHVGELHDEDAVGRRAQGLVVDCAPCARVQVFPPASNHAIGRGWTGQNAAGAAAVGLAGQYGDEAVRADVNVAIAGPVELKAKAQANGAANLVITQGDRCAGAGDVFPVEGDGVVGNVVAQGSNGRPGCRIRHRGNDHLRHNHFRREGARGQDEGEVVENCAQLAVYQVVEVQGDVTRVLHHVAVVDFRARIHRDLIRGGADAGCGAHRLRQNNGRVHAWDNFQFYRHNHQVGAVAGAGIGVIADDAQVGIVGARGQSGRIKGNLHWRGGAAGRRAVGWRCAQPGHICRVVAGIARPGAGKFHRVNADVVRVRAAGAAVGHEVAEAKAPGGAAGDAAQRHRVLRPDVRIAGRRQVRIDGQQQGGKVTYIRCRCAHVGAGAIQAQSQLQPVGERGRTDRACPEAEGVAVSQIYFWRQHPVADGGYARAVVEVSAGIGVGRAGVGREHPAVALEPVSSANGAAVVLEEPAQARQGGDVIKAFAEAFWDGAQVDCRFFENAPDQVCFARVANVQRLLRGGVGFLRGAQAQRIHVNVGRQHRCCRGNAHAPTAVDVARVADGVVDHEQAPRAVGIRAVEDRQLRGGRRQWGRGREGVARVPVGGQVRPRDDLRAVRQRVSGGVVEDQVDIDQVEAAARVRHDNDILPLRPYQQDVNVIRPGVVHVIEVDVDVRDGSAQAGDQHV